MDDDDEISTATMTSVTADLSLDESDTTTSSNDIDTSSQITTSEANEEGNTTVAHTPQLHMVDGSVVVDHDTQSIGCAIQQKDNNEEQIKSISVEQDSPHTTHPSKAKSKVSQPDYASSNDTTGSGSMCLPDLLSGPGNWYEHQCFDLYWRHYHYVSMWRQKHLEVYRSVVQQYSAMVTQQAAARQAKAKNSNTQPVFKKPISSRTIRNRKARRRRRVAKQRMRMALKNAELAGSASMSLSSDEEQKKEESVEGETTQSAMEGTGEEGQEEEVQMEISDEMLDFFAHTHKHRQERDALKKKNKEKDQKHVNIEDAKSNQKERTADAPTERPGSKRTSEMRLLYGKGAAMIHGMETALQMTFDRNLDVLQPKLWPNMPFRVVFS